MKITERTHRTIKKNYGNSLKIEKEHSENIGHHKNPNLPFIVRGEGEKSQVNDIYQICKKIVEENFKKLKIYASIHLQGTPKTSDKSH